MRSTFKILYYINRCKVKADGTTAIMCRITIDGKNSVFATGCYCNPKELESQDRRGKGRKDKQPP